MSTGEVSASMTEAFAEFEKRRAAPYGDLRTLAEAATSGPWIECGHGRGGCKCGFVFSKPADAPIAEVTIGVWGDEWPSMRQVGGSIEGKFEAFMDGMDYGEVPEDKGKANAAYIAAAHPQAIIALLDEIDRLRAVLDARE